MGVEIAISIAREETRVAVLDNGVVTDLYGDRAMTRTTSATFTRGGSQSVAGYAGGVHRYRAGEKAAFMHVSDLSMDVEQGDTLVEGDDEDNKDSEVPKPKRQSSNPSRSCCLKGRRSWSRFPGRSGQRVACDDVCVVAGPLPGVYADGGAYRRVQAGFPVMKSGRA